MPFSIVLPGDLRKQGWKVKIREKERAEPPHVSVIRKMETWRWGLREQKFLDKKPPARNIPLELVSFLRTNIKTFILEWNHMYPHNPVQSEGKK